MIKTNSCSHIRGCSGWAKLGAMMVILGCGSLASAQQHPFPRTPPGANELPPGYPAIDNSPSRTPIRDWIGYGRPLDCWASFNGYSCGSLRSECAFLFGSCRTFFGERCLKGAPPSPLPPWAGPESGYGQPPAGPPPGYAQNQNQATAPAAAHGYRQTPPPPGYAQPQPPHSHPSYNPSSGPGYYQGPSNAPVRGLFAPRQPYPAPAAANSSWGSNFLGWWGSNKVSPPPAAANNPQQTPPPPLAQPLPNPPPANYAPPANPNYAPVNTNQNYAPAVNTNYPPAANQNYAPPVNTNYPPAVSQPTHLPPPPPAINAATYWDRPKSCPDCI
jgi:hypothetical protein